MANYATLQPPLICPPVTWYIHVCASWKVHIEKERVCVDICGSGRGEICINVHTLKN